MIRLLFVCLATMVVLFSASCDGSGEALPPAAAATNDSAAVRDELAVAGDRTSSIPIVADRLAFPTAEGYGRFAAGGRGGDVYKVTTLADSGPGSLRQGILSAKGPRTIVFDVSGNIELKTNLKLEKSNITIAGQSAPGDGIALKDHTFEINNAQELVIRYIRIRYGDENKLPGTKDYKDPDALRTENIHNVIFDHVSASWGVDGVYDQRGAGNVTVQWSIFAEPLNHSFHPEGVDHGLLSSYRDIKGNISIHHSLFASAKNRQPTLCGGSETNPHIILDFRNNVSYDWKGATNLGTCQQNVVNNYYRPGPDTSPWKQDENDDKKPLQAKADNEQLLEAVKAYVHGNIFEGNELYSDNNYEAIQYVNFKKDAGNTAEEQLKISEEIAQGEALPHTDTAEDAYSKVLDKAGASLHRDAADERLIQGIRDKTSKIIDTPSQVGGWPELASEHPATDTDGDGMPDDWESAHGLDPKRAEDRNDDFNGDGYTNLEKYLNERAGDIRY